MLRTTELATQYRPTPAGREKQNTAEKIGMIVFIIFMEAIMLFCWSFPESLEAEGISFTLIHWVTAESTGMASAAMISRMLPCATALEK